MKTKSFPTEYLKELAWESVGSAFDGYVLLSNDQTSRSRWHTHFTMVFSYDNEYWGVDYMSGATEMQDCYPFEDEGETVECYAVEAKTKTVIYYEKVK